MSKKEQRYKLVGTYDNESKKKGHREIFYFVKKTKGDGLTIDDILKIDQITKLDQVINNDYFKESSK